MRPDRAAQLIAVPTVAATAPAGAVRQRSVTLIHARSRGTRLSANRLVRVTVAASRGVPLLVHGVSDVSVQRTRPQTLSHGLNDFSGRSRRLDPREVPRLV